MEYIKKPEWLKVRLNTSPQYKLLQSLVRKNRLTTVCEEAKCPNIHECWGQHGVATFMILGDTCTRRCRFCAVKTGLPDFVDELEPVRVAQSVKKLHLSHVVITMVNRDELEDGGASIMARTVQQIRVHAPTCTIELLTSDFMGKRASLETVLAEEPEVMSHNVETVVRLTPYVRSRSSYARSLEILRMSSEIKPNVLLKSSIMIGLGETHEEILSTLQDLLENGVQVVNIGQYLQPTKLHLKVQKYWSPEEFSDLKAEALKLGFLHCEAAPLVRSSYHSGMDYEQILKRTHPLLTHRKTNLNS